MNDRQETIADITAEMRDEAARADMEQVYSLDDAAEMMREFASRIDEAHKRERGVAVTGSNQLREALVKARHFIDSSPLVYIEDNTGTIARGKLCAEIDAALAAPATAEKSSAVCDVAKLREALKLCLRGMCGYCRMDAEARGMTTECVHGCEALLKAKAALAAPPRNCDVYTADELKVIFKRELASELPIANEHEKNLITITAMRMIDTLFATTKEGGSDGNK